MKMINMLSLFCYLYPSPSSLLIPFDVQVNKTWKCPFFHFHDNSQNSASRKTFRFTHLSWCGVVGVCSTKRKNSGKRNSSQSKHGRTLVSWHFRHQKHGLLNSIPLSTHMFLTRIRKQDYILSTLDIPLLRLFIYLRNIFQLTLSKYKCQVNFTEKTTLLVLTVFK